MKEEEEEGEDDDDERERERERKKKKISAKKTIHNFRDTNFMLILFELLPVLVFYVHTCC